MGKKKGKSKYTRHLNVLREPIKIMEDDAKPNLDMITAALNSANQVIFMKVCRLCETKDGPFLNIFDADKITAKKIDYLMPFGIAENDDLPHKICFRCSAKVEELHEFIQKCIKTQHSLHSAMGKKAPLITKTKTRTLWEEKLNKSNMSNDDICDALIKKAMEGIKDMPLKPLPAEESDSAIPTKKEVKSAQVIPAPTKRETRSNIDTTKESDDDVPLKQTRSSRQEVEKSDENRLVSTRASRSQAPVDFLLDGLPDTKKKKPVSKHNSPKIQEEPQSRNISVKDFSLEDKNLNSDQKEEVSEKTTEKSKPFDIMDHVSMIKVNGVGVLFQCKLCNRNFLKKEVVMSHGCAKTGVPKVNVVKNYIPPEPPKQPVVKYINTRIDDDIKKPIEIDDNEKKEVDIKKTEETKSKPKIGPASKVKRDKGHSSVVGMTVIGMQVDSTASKPSTNLNPITPTVKFPSLPSLSSRYKLVPGPNNTFTLVEEAGAANPEQESENDCKPGKKRKNEVAKTDAKGKKSTESSESRSTPEIIDLEELNAEGIENSQEQPYPVGLFQTLPHSSIYPSTAAGPPFTTPAMKKQSYTVVQTGNPSKLLISTKPQAEVEEVPKKKQKRGKPSSKPETEVKQPFKVTLEDVSPAKDAGFFTFINVDPLLQPSYVLPTDNIIQESQISTSTPVAKPVPDLKDNKYSCNMCGESFSREKKLLTHIQSHYTKMDEEDQLRAEKNTRKRTGRKN